MNNNTHKGNSIKIGSGYCNGDSTSINADDINININLGNESNKKNTGETNPEPPTTNQERHNRTLCIVITVAIFLVVIAAVLGNIYIGSRSLEFASTVAMSSS